MKGKKPRKNVRCTRHESKKADGPPGCGRQKKDFLKGTFFGGTKLHPHEILKISYECALESKPNVTARKLGHSCDRITNWFGFLHTLLSAHLKTTAMNRLEVRA